LQSQALQVQQKLMQVQVDHLKGGAAEAAAAASSEFDRNGSSAGFAHNAEPSQLQLEGSASQQQQQQQVDAGRDSGVLWSSLLTDVAAGGQVAGMAPMDDNNLNGRQPQLNGRQPQLTGSQQSSLLLQASISSLPLPPLTPLPLVRSLLCYTLSGHRCELLTVTDFSSPLDVVAQRECVVITARVHPGESCASWIMQVMSRSLAGTN
jgi:hypothetical protein